MNKDSSQLLEWSLSKADALCQRAESWFASPIPYLRLAVWCCIVSILARWPIYERIPSAHPTWFIQVLDWQTHHPFQKLPLDRMIPAEFRRNGNGFASHLDKRETRLVLPLLGYLTGLHFGIYMAANHLAGLLFFALFAYVIRNQTQSAGIAVLASMAYALSYAGAHFFEDYYLGDGVAIVCLLASIVVRRPILIAACVSLAGMTDERALFASLLAYLYWQIQQFGVSELSLKTLARPSRQGLAVIAGWSVFLLWRLILVFSFGLSTGHTDVANWKILLFHAQHYPGNVLTVYGCLSGILLIAALSTYLSCRKGVIALCIALSLTPAFLVYDFQRSVSFDFTILIIAFGIASRTEPRLTRLAVATGLVGNILLTCVPDTIVRLAWYYPHWFQS